jgi:hypothetical protein
MLFKNCTVFAKISAKEQLKKTNYTFNNIESINKKKTLTIAV